MKKVKYNTYNNNIYNINKKEIIIEILAKV